MVGVITAFFPLTVTGQGSEALPPPSKAALKFSPGHLASEILKKDPFGDGL